MKLYRSTLGTFYEKQADVPKGTKFEAVEFPFAASPKADFVDWMNDQQAGAYPGVTVADITEPNAVEPPAPVEVPVTYTAQSISFEDGFDAMPLSLQLHYAALAVENARKARP